MSKENEIPAFPMGYHRDGNSADHYGMTLRDFFAAKAMASRIINLGDHTHTGSNWTEASAARDACCKETAERAYAMADAMMKARANPTTEKSYDAGFEDGAKFVGNVTSPSSPPPSA